MNQFIAVPRKYLLLTSGLMWSGVGLMLISLATRWLLTLSLETPFLMVISGIIPGILISLFGFSRIVTKNILRIEQMEPKVSVFAFQAWHSYVLIVIMMSMGVFVRTSGLVPLMLRTPGYFAIGTALSFSSLRYFKTFFSA